MASIRFWVCIFKIPLYLAQVELNHLFIPPNVRSTLKLVFPISLFLNISRTVSGCPFLALCNILLFNFLRFNISSFFAERQPFYPYLGAPLRFRPSGSIC